MGLKDATVVFDRPDRTYAPGQLVQGRLDFQQDKDKTFRGMYVKGKGFCATHWTTSHTRRIGRRTQRYTRHHSAHEKYFKQVVYLVGGESGLYLKAKGFCRTHWTTSHSTTNSDGKSESQDKDHSAHEEYFQLKVYFVGGESGECTISPGKYSFPFQILLPPDCPSSFEALYGYIRYEFTFVVDRAFKIDQQITERITVVGTCDPNVNPYCRHPMVIEMSKSYYTLFVNRGAVQALVKVPKAGFCPGEVIPIEVTCDNNSNLNLDKIKFQIRETTTFRATDDTRHSPRVITKEKRGPLPNNSSHKWEVELVVPPDLILYNVDRCQWIDVHYDLVITISSPRFHHSLKESRRIILGHVPLIIPDGTDKNTMQESTVPYLAICPTAPPDYGDPPSYNYNGMPVDNIAAGSSSNFKSSGNQTHASGSAAKASLGFGESSCTEATGSRGQDGYVAPFPPPPPPYTQYGPDTAPSAPEPTSPDADIEKPPKL